MSESPISSLPSLRLNGSGSLGLGSLGRQALNGLPAPDTDTGGCSLSRELPFTFELVDALSAEVERVADIRKEHRLIGAGLCHPRSSRTAAGRFTSGSQRNSHDPYS
jgi:hypothetical protein